MTPNECLGILLKFMLLLISSSEDQIPTKSSNKIATLRILRHKHAWESWNMKSKSAVIWFNIYPITNTQQFATTAAVVSSTLLLKSHQPWSQNETTSLTNISVNVSTGRKVKLCIKLYCTRLDKSNQFLNWKMVDNLTIHNISI